MAARFTEFFANVSKNPKGVGSGLGGLLALVGLGYGATQSIFTGKLFLAH